MNIVDPKRDSRCNTLKCNFKTNKLYLHPNGKYSTFVKVSKKGVGWFHLDNQNFKLQ